MNLTSRSKPLLPVDLRAHAPGRPGAVEQLAIVWHPELNAEARELLVQWAAAQTGGRR